MEKEIKCYEKTFDYEDMKIAITVSQFFDKHEAKMEYYETFEDLIQLCMEIKTKWLEFLGKGFLLQEEYAYIQCFAENYLLAKFI